MRAVQINEFGGPEVLELVELPDPEPAEGEVLVEVARAGMNFADTHQRHNQYLAKAELPLIPGVEISGRTPDGRRVAAILNNGGYAERVAVPESALVRIPDEVSDEQAAAILLQGLTAWALLRVSARLQPGETVVVEAAAGGTGTLAVQLAKAIGARVIGLASTAEKRELVERLGADATVDSGARRCRDDGGADRGERRRAGRRRPADVGRRGLRPADGGAGAVRPHGHLRDRLPRAEPDQEPEADAKQSLGRRILDRAPAAAARSARGGDRRVARAL